MNITPLTGPELMLICYKILLHRIYLVRFRFWNLFLNTLGKTVWFCVVKLLLTFCQFHGSPAQFLTPSVCVTSRDHCVSYTTNPSWWPFLSQYPLSLSAIGLDRPSLHCTPYKPFTGAVTYRAHYTGRHPHFWFSGGLGRSRASMQLSQ